VPKWVKLLEIISGPRPAPALSCGSNLKERMVVPASDGEYTPNLYLNPVLFPVDPYLKYLETESSKCSINEL
jgi:hypothetical protein